jgi:hypothetical protein
MQDIFVFLIRILYLCFVTVLNRKPLSFILFSSFFIAVLGGGALWLLQFIKYIILEFPPSTILLYLPLLPFLEQFQQVPFKNKNKPKPTV